MKNRHHKKYPGKMKILVTCKFYYNPYFDCCYLTKSSVRLASAITYNRNKDLWICKLSVSSSCLGTFYEQKFTHSAVVEKLYTLLLMFTLS